MVLPAGLKRGANRRLAGEDIARGTTVRCRRAPPDAARHRRSSRRSGSTARAGARAVCASRVFSTGDEIVEPGEPLRPAELYDANRFLLAAAPAGSAAASTDLGILPDEPARDCAGRSPAPRRGHDLMLTSGGVSTGEEDHVRAAVESAGALVFWRVAIKPGRPVAMGVVARARRSSVCPAIRSRLS